MKLNIVQLHFLPNPKLNKLNYELKTQTKPQTPKPLIQCLAPSRSPAAMFPRSVIYLKD
jgi:hypothetical protein